MDIYTLTTVGVIINGINVFLIAITAWLIRKQIADNSDWNERKTSQEILNNLTTGEYAAIKSELYAELGCDFSDACQTYSELKLEKSKEENKKLTLKLAKFFNILEVICINMKNGIVKEDICKNYLSFMFGEYWRWGFPFIDQERNRCSNKKLFLEFEKYAKKWHPNLAF